MALHTQDIQLWQKSLEGKCGGTIAGMAEVPFRKVVVWGPVLQFLPSNRMVIVAASKGCCEE